MLLTHHRARKLIGVWLLLLALSYVQASELHKLKVALEDANWKVVAEFLDDKSSGGYGGGLGKENTLNEIRLCKEKLVSLFPSGEVASPKQSLKPNILPSRDVRKNGYSGPIINFRVGTSNHLIVDFVSCSYH